MISKPIRKRFGFNESRIRILQLLRCTRIWQRWLWYWLLRRQRIWVCGRKIGGRYLEDVFWKIGKRRGV